MYVHTQATGTHVTVLTVLTITITITIDVTICHAHVYPEAEVRAVQAWHGYLFETSYCVLLKDSCALLPVAHLLDVATSHLLWARDAYHTKKELVKVQQIRGHTLSQPLTWQKSIQSPRRRAQLRFDSNTAHMLGMAPTH